MRRAEHYECKALFACLLTPVAVLMPLCFLQLRQGGWGGGWGRMEGGGGLEGRILWWAAWVEVGWIAAGQLVCRVAAVVALFLLFLPWGVRGGGGGEGSAVTTSAEVHGDAFLVLGHQWPRLQLSFLEWGESFWSDRRVILEGGESFWSDGRVILEWGESFWSDGESFWKEGVILEGGESFWREGMRGKSFWREGEGEGSHSGRGGGCHQGNRDDWNWLPWRENCGLVVYLLTSMFKLSFMFTYWRTHSQIDLPI